MVYGLEHRQALVQQLCLILGKIAYLHIVADLQVTVKGYLAHDTFHQRRLSFAVLSHKGHFLAALDGQCHLVKHPVGTIVFPDVLADDGIVT